jgi:hypothetical protein
MRRPVMLVAWIGVGDESLSRSQSCHCDFLTCWIGRARSKPDRPSEFCVAQRRSYPPRARLDVC